MPEKPPSSRDRPTLMPEGAPTRARLRRPGEPAYAELLAASNFSFLRGASHPEELAATAAALGLAGFSVTDRNTLAGIVRGHLAAKQTGARYAVGCRLAFRDGTPDIVAWPRDRAAYGRLCRLLTTGNLRAKKGECHLDLADLLEWGEGLELAVLPDSLPPCGGGSGRGEGPTLRSEKAGPPGSPHPEARAGGAPAAPGSLEGRGRGQGADDSLYRVAGGSRLAPAALAPHHEEMEDAARAAGSVTSPSRGGRNPQAEGAADFGRGAGPGGSAVRLSLTPSRNAARFDLPSRGRLEEAAARFESPLEATLGALTETFPGHVRVGARCLYRGDDRRRLAEIAALAERFKIPVIALGDVLYHAPERRRLQDVLSCVREHATLESAGRLLEMNAERHMKDAAQMERLFRDVPGAIGETLNVLERLTFSLDELAYDYPLESTGESATPFDELVRLTFEGAARRYPDGMPDNVAKVVDHELTIIKELRYEPYFLTVWDIVRYARSRDILCQGRGSAANSAVCYCLGITEVDPKRGDLLFERFVSPERGEPPDIDVDFEHERREEVIQYVFEKYGREHAGLTATVITYRSRSAAREVGKAFGLSEDTVGALAGTIWGWSSGGVAGEDARRAGLDPDERRIAQVLALTQEIIGFPRHLSQHVGGFLITRSRLDEVVPILHSAMEGRNIVEWDKDDLDALKMLKIDVLALGMLTAMKKALDLIETHYGKQLTLASIPAEESEVYDMICRADTIGVFQIESRAQMTMLPRLKPRNYYDLVIEVAIVRPGPIQGDMVHPYLRRRQGLEAVRYPSPHPDHGPPDELQRVLGKTLGVPLFQEQAMRIAIEAAKFTPGEADRLRRAMATFRRVGTIHMFQAKMVEGMVARGYQRDFAERCFRQIEGFGDYGFPESHAASFALLVYTSAWVKCRYPDVFCASLLNAQPMGFYAPAQLVRDAREHGVEVRAVDVNFSEWATTLESPSARSPSPLAGEGPGEGGAPHPPHLDGEDPQAPHLERNPPPAMPHSHVFDDERRFAKRLRHHQTKAEEVIWREIRAGRLGPKFRRQAPMGRYVADFVCHEAKLVVELDGEAHRDAEAHDIERDAWFRSRGYRTLRLSNDAVLRYPERVVEAIRRACGSPPSPLPGPPPQGGRESTTVHPRHSEQIPAIRATHAVRLGFRQIKGFREDDATRLVAARQKPFRSVRDLWLRSGISRGGLERLAEADAFRSMGLDRRRALWEVRALDPLSAAERLPLFAAAERESPADLQSEAPVALPLMAEGEHVVSDYRSLSLSLKAHPVSFLRAALTASGIVEAGRLAEMKTGRRVSVAGLVLVRQRPGTASGVIFATLEDETGVANIIVWPKIFERFRPVVMGARLMRVTGRLQSEQGVIHVVAERLEDITALLSRLSEAPLGASALAPTDEVRRPIDEMRLKVKPSSRMARLLAADPELVAELEGLAGATAAAMPKGRNFH